MKRARVRISYFVRVLGIGLCLFCLVSSVYAAELSDDRYASIVPETAEPPSQIERSMQHFLVYPFEVARFFMDETLTFLDEYHIYDKAKYVYDKIQSYGISPRVRWSSSDSRSYGADFDVIRLMGKKENFPDATLSSWITWGENSYFRGGGKVGWSRIKGTRHKTYGLVNYENQPETHFYGLGPHSSAGDGSVFSREETTLKYVLGCGKDPIMRADASFSYKNVNISGGRDGGRGQLGEVPSFSRERIPGIGGDSILTWGIDLSYDTRNQKENSVQGGLHRLAFSFNEGLNSSLARYFKYEAEVDHYFRLGSDRRVLAVHFYGEHNDEVNDGQVPFHQMARMGGFGSFPEWSHPLRGYDTNRFYDESMVLFNIEYRYAVWEYRDMKVDAVLFWDEGQVFGEFSEFQMKDFRESYGAGLRFSLAEVMLLGIEVAHGDEGTNFYVKGSTPF